MRAKRLIRFERFGNEEPHFADAALEMGAHERDELVARVRIYPDAVLDADESDPLQEPSKLAARLPSPLADVEDKHAPLPVPECRLGYRILAEFYPRQQLSPLFCNLHT